MARKRSLGIEVLRAVSTLIGLAFVAFLGWFLLFRSDGPNPGAPSALEFEEVAGADDGGADNNGASDDGGDDNSPEGGDDSDASSDSGRGERETGTDGQTSPAPSPAPAVLLASFDTIARDYGLDQSLQSPLGCDDVVDERNSVSGVSGLRVRCAAGGTEVAAMAPGRIVLTQSALARTQRTEGVGFDWSDLTAMGNFVVVDHGGLGNFANVQIVYRNLSDIDDDLRIGQEVSPGDPLGVAQSDANGQEVVLELWLDSRRFDVSPDRRDVSDTDVGLAVRLAPVAVPPVDPRCPLPLGTPDLFPNAPREYRNGTHRGVDFNCNAVDRGAMAFRAGEVVYATSSDRIEPTTPNREALLAIAGNAGFTPHWTLMMLYGNVVIIDHGNIDGVGRVHSISAHLASIEDDIKVGANVAAGQRLGIIGNTGTSTAAAATTTANDSSLHLHWELFIDGRYLGEQLDFIETELAYDTLFCREGSLLSGC